MVRLRLLAPLLTLTGALSLIYQVVWAHQLALITDDRARLEYSGKARVLGRFGSARALLRFNPSPVFDAARSADRAP